MIPFEKINSDADGRVPTIGGNQTTGMEYKFNWNFDQINLELVRVYELLDNLSYIPLVINLFTLNGYKEYYSEKGSTVTSLSFLWGYNKDILTQSITHLPIINNSIRAYNLSGTFTSNTDFTLTATDGDTTISAITELMFLDSMYYGVSTSPTLNNADVLGLSNVLAKDFERKVVFDCSGGKYFYFAFPSVWGVPRFRVGGFNFTAMVKENIPIFTNSSWHTLSLDVWRVQDIQFGSNIEVEILR